jgi:hypothetical protein
MVGTATHPRSKHRTVSRRKHLWRLLEYHTQLDRHLQINLGLLQHREPSLRPRRKRLRLLLRDGSRPRGNPLPIRHPHLIGLRQDEDRDILTLIHSLPSRSRSRYSLSSHSNRHLSSKCSSSHKDQRIIRKITFHMTVDSNNSRHRVIHIISRVLIMLLSTNSHLLNMVSQPQVKSRNPNMLLSIILNSPRIRKSR